MFSDIWFLINFLSRQYIILYHQKCIHDCVHNIHHIHHIQWQCQNFEWGGGGASWGERPQGGEMMTSNTKNGGGGGRSSLTGRKRPPQKKKLGRPGGGQLGKNAPIPAPYHHIHIWHCPWLCPIFGNFQRRSKSSFSDTKRSSRQPETDKEGWGWSRCKDHHYLRDWGKLINIHDMSVSVWKAAVCGSFILKYLSWIVVQQFSYHLKKKFLMFPLICCGLGICNNKTALLDKMNVNKNLCNVVFSNNIKTLLF